MILVGNGYRLQSMANVMTSVDCESGLQPHVETYGRKFIFLGQILFWLRSYKEPVFASQTWADIEVITLWTFSSCDLSTSPVIATYIHTYIHIIYGLIIFRNATPAPPIQRNDGKTLLQWFFNVEDKSVSPADLIRRLNPIPTES